MSDISNQTGSKKFKLIAIALLAVVFGYVLYSNVFDNGAKKPAANVAVPPSSTSSPSSSNELSTTATPNPKAASWPSFTLDEIVGHSPFDPLYGSKSIKRDPKNITIEPAKKSVTVTSPSTGNPSQSKTSLTQTTKNGSHATPSTSSLGVLQAVFKNENGVAAIVDSKIVRPGDSINGVKIIAITPTTIYLEDRRTIEAEKSTTTTSATKN